MAISVYFDGTLLKQLGAYVKTDLSAVRQINGVATGVVGALGLAEGGPADTPVRLTSHAESVAIFRGGPLVEHIKTMFLGGAGEVVAVRVGAPTASALNLTGLDDGAMGTWSLDFTSIEKSSRVNNILVELDVDDEGTSGDATDDSLIVTVLQKHPDCKVTKEIFEFPKQFAKETVLVRRGDRLFFVQEWMIDQALGTLGVSPTNQEIEDAILDVIKDELFPDDNVQIFHKDTAVPLGLVIYELNEGNLFGFERSRMLTSTVNGTAADTTVEIADLFNQNPSPFYNSGTSAYEFSSVTGGTPALTVDHILTTNSTVVGNFYAMTGGTNGDDGTGLYSTGTITTTPGSPAMTSWVTGLQALENEEVSFVQPCYRFHYSTILDDRTTYFSAVMGYVISHVKTMSNVAQRKRRTSIIGFPAPRTDAQAKAAYLTTAIDTLTSIGSDTDRLQSWIAPFKSTIATGKEDLLGGEFVASYMAGRHANREPQLSVTFTPVGSLGADWLYEWTYADKDRLISQRLAFVEKVKNSFGATLHRVHHNPTTWLGAVTEGYQEFVLRRVDDFVSTYLYKNVEAQFIGRPSFGRRTDDEIRSYVENLLGTLVGKQIVAFRNVNVTHNEDNTVYSVDFEMQPVTEIKFILMTMKVQFDLE